MAREVEFTAEVLERVVQRQQCQCGRCGDQLTSDFSGDSVIPAESFAAQSDGQTFLKSEDNCVAVCQECHSFIDGASTQLGKVAPPEFYPHSHGTDSSAHKEWARHIYVQWYENRIRQLSRPAVEPDDKHIVREVRYHSSSVDDNPAFKKRNARHLQGAKLEDAVSDLGQAQEAFTASVQASTHRAEGLSNFPPTTGGDGLTALIVQGSIALAAVSDLATSTEGVKRVKDAVSKGLSKAHGYAEGAWWKLNTKVIRSELPSEDESLTSSIGAAREVATPLTPANLEPASNELPGQANESRSPVNESPAHANESGNQNVESPATRESHSVTAEDASRVHSSRPPGPVPELAQGTEANPRPATWESLAIETGVAPDHRPKDVIANEFTARKVDFPVERTLYRWTEADNARVEWMISQVHDKESAALVVQELKEMAHHVDFRAETNGNHVLYAKRKNHQIADDFTSIVEGFKTLDQTAAGKAMSQIYQNEHFTPEHHKMVFGALSEQFVRDARGTLVVFDAGYPTFTEYPENSEHRKAGQSQLDANIAQLSTLYIREFPALSENSSIDRVIWNPPRELSKDHVNHLRFTSGLDGGGLPPDDDGGGGGSPTVTRRSSVLVPDSARLSLKKSSDDSVAKTAPSAPMTPALESPKSGVPAKSISVGNRHDAIQQTSEPGLSPEQKSASKPQLEVSASKVETERQTAPEIRAPATGPAQTTPAVPKMEASQTQVRVHESSAPKQVATPAPKAEAGRQAAPEIRAVEPSASQKATTAPKVEAPKTQVRAPEASVPKQVAAPAPKAEAGRQAAPEVRAPAPTPSQKATTAPKVEAHKTQVRAPEPQAPKQVAAPAPKVEAGRQAQPEARAPAPSASQKATTAPKVEAPKTQVRAPETSAPKQVAVPAPKVEAGRQTQSEVRAPASPSQKAVTAPKVEAPKTQVRAPETQAPKQVATPAPKVEAGRQTQPEVRAPAPGASQKAVTAPKVEASKTQVRAPEASPNKQVITPTPKVAARRQAAPEARAPGSSPSQKTAATKVETARPQLRSPEAAASKQTAVPAPKAEAGRQAVGETAAKKAPERSASNAPKKDTVQHKPAITAQAKAPNATQSTSNAPAKSPVRSGPAPAQKVATPTPAKTPVAKRPPARSVPTPTPRPVQAPVRQPPPPRIQPPASAPARPAPSIPAPRPSLPAVRPTPPAPSVRPSGNGKGMG